MFCHVYGRGDRKRDQFVPSWPYSFVAALGSGLTSWVALLDAVRLGPADDATFVTAAQLRDVVQRLALAAGRPGDSARDGRRLRRRLPRPRPDRPACDAAQAPVPIQGPLHDPVSSGVPCWPVLGGDIPVRAGGGRSAGTVSVIMRVSKSHEHLSTVGR
ncbi:transposase [Streptomyces sp. ST1015]|nr:transposase [Streptomyces sp. ST1015]